MSQAQPNAREASPRRKLVGHPFRKGVSGNPGGRPRSDPQVRELARQYGAEAIAKLVSLMRGKDSRIALAAAEALLDRGFGKPAQAVTGLPGPLVALNFGGQPGDRLSPGERVSPELAYRLMCDGSMPIDPNYFRPAIEAAHQGPDSPDEVPTLTRSDP